MRKIALTFVAVLAALTLVGCDIGLPGFPGSDDTQVPLTTPSPITTGWTAPPFNGGMALPNIAEVVPLITPYVVSVQTEAITFDIFRRPFPERGAGSGIVIDSNGYIVTNNHVVQDATRVTVTLEDKRTFDAVEVRRDPQTDIAVIKIDASGLPAAKLGDSRNLRVGDWVIAVGNALALEGGPTVTKGIVSYLGRTIQEGQGLTLYDLIQTDAPINPGNSGGPLVNMAGEVVGINTAIAGEAQNIGFALSITPATRIVEDLVNRGFVTRAFLGIQMETVTPTIARLNNLSVQEGVLVVAVVGGSPADKAGLRVGDVIIQFSGQEVITMAGLRQAILSRSIGEEVEIVFYRGPTQSTTRAVLGESSPS